MKYDKEVLEEVYRILIGMVHYRFDPDNHLKLIPKDERSTQLIHLAAKIKNDFGPNNAPVVER